MQYKVPQKIDLEDRIIGPLTMRQFGYVFAGGMVDYLLYAALNPYGVFVFGVFAFLPTLLALALAFIKVQDQTFGSAIASFLLLRYRDRLFLWRRTPDPRFLRKQRKVEKPAMPRKNVNASDLDRLAAIIDNRGWSALDANGQLHDRVISAAEAIPSTDNLETTSS